MTRAHGLGASIVEEYGSYWGMSTCPTCDPEPRVREDE